MAPTKDAQTNAKPESRRDDREGKKNDPQQGQGQPIEERRAEAESAAPVRRSEPAPTRRVVIRSGDIEFEVDSFDCRARQRSPSSSPVSRARSSPPSTATSSPNGKVKGSVTVRMPPESLDSLVLDLRRELGKTGELKGVRIVEPGHHQAVHRHGEPAEGGADNGNAPARRSSRKARARSNNCSKPNANSACGGPRSRNSRARFAITRTSRHSARSRSPSPRRRFAPPRRLTENERVQAGVEVEDVDKAYQAVLAAVVEAKGRVTKSELKQLSAGPVQRDTALRGRAGSRAARSATGSGNSAAWPGSRSTACRNADGTLPSNAKLTRGDTVFLVQLYNLANIAPRETATLQIAVADVPTAYQNLRDEIAKSAGRVLVAQLNEQGQAECHRATRLRSEADRRRQAPRGPRGGRRTPLAAGRPRG